MLSGRVPSLQQPESCSIAYLVVILEVMVVLPSCPQKFVQLHFSVS